LEYVKSDDCVVISGARGVSVWRVFRKIVSSSQASYVFERLFAFQELALVWVSKMTYEASSGYLYAFVDTSVHALSLTHQKVVHKLDHIHDTPVTACIWYAPAQMYITGAQRGEVKCINAAKALLHEFRIHTAAVTALARHPTPGTVDRHTPSPLSLSLCREALSRDLLPYSPPSPPPRHAGMAVSTSLDGHVKVPLCHSPLDIRFSPWPSPSPFPHLSLLALSLPGRSWIWTILPSRSTSTSAPPSCT